MSNNHTPNPRLRARALVCLVPVVAFSVSCSSDDQSTVTVPSDVTISNIASPTDPVLTAPPTSTIDTDIPDAGLPQTEVVNITVEVAAGNVEEASVPLGSPVNIRVRGSVQDQYHLHGYDLELEGTDVLFTFTADRLGTFVLEGHDSSRELLILTVFED